jgi:thiopurine S-methyltransferase
MEKEFWLERWQREEIGFHEGQVNAYLTQFLPELKLAAGAGIFVPLCGKSVDMLWLREQGHPVLGVELSSIAVQAFFAEHAYVPAQGKQGAFECCSVRDIRILCGDFFDLKREDVAAVQAVYDRASMIALPPEMRKRYVQKLVEILPPSTQILLVAIDYPQQEMPGPPFALSAAEVRGLYGPHAEIKQLLQADVLEQNPRFKSRGLSRMQESVYLLTLLPVRQ